jgi:hypothetical protein
VNRVLGISVDCVNTALVAQFWMKALDGRISMDASTHLAVVEAKAGPAVRLIFREVPERKFLKNRVHLDLVTDSFHVESARLLSLGAVRLRDVLENNTRWTTFADIEGNEFDLIDAISLRMQPQPDF